MRIKQSEVPIRREDVQRAMEDFFKTGGTIKVLPNQVAPSRSTIGGAKWQAYETFEDLVWA